MTFSEYTDTWFDRLADCRLADPVATKLRAAVAAVPNEPALRKLREVAAELPPDCAGPLTAHIDAILLGRIADEYAIIFSTAGREVSATGNVFTATGREVSATGELFSLVRQAANYHID